jgi:hypothetical protein
MTLDYSQFARLLFLSKEYAVGTRIVGYKDGSGAVELGNAGKIVRVQDHCQDNLE